MNLSDCKTIEEYREAAHYWQKKWAENDAELELIRATIKVNIGLTEEDLCKILDKIVNKT